MFRNCSPRWNSTFATARCVGATANFAGSGGAIVGTYKGEPMFQALVSALQPVGVAVFKPVIVETAS